MAAARCARRGRTAHDGRTDGARDRRLDPARDLIVAEQAFVGARPVYRGRIGIDATWKEGYPVPVDMDPEVTRLVDRRWGEFFS